MYNKERITIYTIIKAIFMIFVFFATLYPFIYMISVSLSSNEYILNNAVSFYPRGINFKVYEIILRDARILIAYKNTILYVVTGTVISLSTTCMAAYALSKKKKKYM